MRNTLAIFAALLTGGCDQFVEKSKLDESQAKLTQVQTELEQTKKQLAEAQEKINELSAKKFSTYESGNRTWRFDSATGETCILLTSERDWKNKGTKAEGCSC